MQILKILQDLENSFRESIDKFRIPLFLISGTSLALLLRYFLLDFESTDYHDSLSRWVDFIKSHGGFKALQYNFSNYTPLYLYALVISTLLPLSKLYAIKVISILFDLLASFFVYKIVKEKYPNSVIPHYAFLTVLFTPTVFM